MLDIITLFPSSLLMEAFEVTHFEMTNVITSDFEVLIVN